MLSHCPLQGVVPSIYMGADEQQCNNAVMLENTWITSDPWGHYSRHIVSKISQVNTMAECIHQGTAVYQREKHRVDLSVQRARCCISTTTDACSMLNASQRVHTSIVMSHQQTRPSAKIPCGGFSPVLAHQTFCNYADTDVQGKWRAFVYCSIKAWNVFLSQFHISSCPCDHSWGKLSCASVLCQPLPVKS